MFHYLFPVGISHKDKRTSTKRMTFTMIFIDASIIQALGSTLLLAPLRQELLPGAMMLTSILKLADNLFHLYISILMHSIVYLTREKWTRV